METQLHLQMMVIKKLHDTNMNLLESRADMLERIQFDVKQGERFDKVTATRKRVEWLLVKQLDNRKDSMDSSFWNRLLHHTLYSMCCDEKMLMNHVEDIWEENELKSGRTWRERRDERGRIVRHYYIDIDTRLLRIELTTTTTTHDNTQAHFEDKASWFRNRRESRLRFTNRFELRISK